MPRPPRVDEEGGFYHALNRGHGRSQIFWTDDDDSALERILAEGLAKYDVSVFSFPIDAKSLASRVAPECHRGPEKESGLVVTERTILRKTKKDLKIAGVIENLTTEVAENKFAAKDERF